MEKQFQNRFNKIKDFVFNYPDGYNITSWEKLFGDWLVKARKGYLKARSRSSIAEMFIGRVVKSFNKLLLDDILFNHVIFSFPFEKMYMFIAQKPEKSKTKKVYLSTGMYNVGVYIYFLPSVRKRVEFKYIYPIGIYRSEINKALKQGHKYPRYEDVIAFINKNVYD